MALHTRNLKTLRWNLHHEKQRELHDALGDIDLRFFANGDIDATRVIQKAIDNAAGGRRPGLVQLPAGEFKVSQQLIINGAASVQGAGKHKTTLNWSGSLGTTGIRIK